MNGCDAKTNWIGEFRERHGLTNDQLAGLITDHTRKHISANLIWILENNGTSVPTIAARIACVLGAGSAEFDSIVPIIYIGKYNTYKPRTRRVITDADVQAYLKRTAQNKYSARNGKRKRGDYRDCREIGVQNPLDVLVINSDGNVVAEYLTAYAVEIMVGDLDTAGIIQILRKGRRDNFIRCGLTYRYRKDFTGEARQKIIETAKQQLTPITDYRKAISSSMIEIDGEVHTLRKWVQMRNACYRKVKNRLSVGWSPKEALEIIHTRSDAR